MIGKGAKVGAALLWAGACMAAVAGPAFAQNKELSDKSVLTLMRYAWGMVPDKFTTPLGKTILVDKTKASETVVPLEMAREVIRVAQLGLRATVRAGRGAAGQLPDADAPRGGQEQVD